ncbi:MAG: hypothetical protein K2H46_11000 [Muribaculaceae bacterium]|nr:hypothetical protein [Muribaculaceae bacterium]
MKHRYLIKLCALALTVMLVGLTGCKEDKGNEPDRDDGKMKKTILLYAVASNNLYSNLINDKQEIIMAVKDNDLDLRQHSIMVYEVIPNNKENGETPRLLELTRLNNGELEYVEVKKYDRSLYSTDPERVAEVIKDMQELRPSKTYGLIMWSHGLGWSPFFSERDSHPAETKSSEPLKANVPMQYSFGYDTNSTVGYTDKTDIDELADAIPENVFEFIWFDACMMTGIETIYEFRDKCRYFGGYPTEVFSPGMPYHHTIPYLLKEKADVAGCAREFFEYYANNPYQLLRVATVAVIDMWQLEKMADFCKTYYEGMPVPSAAGLDYYSGNQRVAYKYYDFGQYTLAKIAESDDENAERLFRELLDKLIVYKNATEKEFTGKTLNLEEYSGISCHLYNPSQTGAAADYYRSLDWFKRVY